MRVVSGCADLLVQLFMQGSARTSETLTGGAISKMKNPRPWPMPRPWPTPWPNPWPGSWPGPWAKALARTLTTSPHAPKDMNMLSGVASPALKGNLGAKQKHRLRGLHFELEGFLKALYRFLLKAF